jgi:hypothetical protein
MASLILKPTHRYRADGRVEYGDVGDNIGSLPIAVGRHTDPLVVGLRHLNEKWSEAR